MENSDTSVIWRMMTNCRKEVDYKVAITDIRYKIARNPSDFIYSPRNNKCYVKRCVLPDFSVINTPKPLQIET